VHGLLDEDFRGRVEPFDNIAATHYAMVVADRDRAGRPISVADAQIASVGRKLQAALAIRNIGGFEQTGLELVDPWHIH
jgi:predicted nucleic acid-binding protein